MDKNQGPEIVTAPVDSSQDYTEEGYQEHVHSSHVIETPPTENGESSGEASSAELAHAIDESCAGIDAGIDAGSYSERKVSEQLRSYDKGGAVEKIVFNITNAQGSDDRAYYYENGSLIYAKREWKNSDEYYFEDGHMVRWLHTGSDGVKEVRDKLVIPEYTGREESVLDEAARYYSSATEALSPSAPQPSEPQDEPGSDKNTESDNYMLPESNSRYISKDELEGFSAWECMVARNEIFARHGRIFNNSDLKEHFNSKSWYKPSVSPDNFDSLVFNDYELKNIDTILAYEKAKGYA